MNSKVTIYKPTGEIRDVIHVLDSSKYQHKINGENIVFIEFHSESPSDITIDDYLIFRNTKFYLNMPLNFKRTGNNSINYQGWFESIQYQLLKVNYRDGKNSDFALTGDLKFFLDLLITNINRVYPTWSIDKYPSKTETNTLQFNNENCLQVLQRLISKYDVDFQITDDKKISVGSFNVAISQEFQYGNHKGAYELSRQLIDSSEIITRIYPQGSDQNIPADYRDYSTRLKISSDYIEKNVATYGIREGSETYENIKPEFEGEIGYIFDSNSFLAAKQNDKSYPVPVLARLIDFNINDYIAPGLTPQIIFQSGQLAGYSFPIFEFNNSLKKIVISNINTEKIINSDGSLENYTLPNSDVTFSVGDKFIIGNILLPDEYITDAENRLYQAGYNDLKKKSEPNVSYNLNLDPNFIDETGIYFDAGYYLHIIDSAISLDKWVRALSITVKITDPNSIKVELSDFFKRPEFVKLNDQIIDLRSKLRFGYPKSQSPIHPSTVTKPPLQKEDILSDNLLSDTNNNDKIVIVKDGKLQVLQNITIDNKTQTISFSKITGPITISEQSSKIGFFGADPTEQSDGWNILNGNLKKTFDAGCPTLEDISNFLYTIIYELKRKGLIK